MSVSTTDFLVKRDDLRARRFASTALPPIGDGEALLRVDAFALTANTVTYAAMGEQLRYWSFFPTGEAGWGRVPCWGFGDVMESNAPGVDVGARYYGYFPIGAHLVVTPARMRETGFVDAAPHRRDLPPVYNGYARAGAETPDAEAMAMLFRPLFTTSWLIDRFLADANFFGAKRVVISSASGKTALGLAWSLKQGGGVEVVGLTSPANAAFVARTRCYDQVVAYADIGSLSAGAPTAYVDFSGSVSVRSALHAHLKNQLVYDCGVGAADWASVGQPQAPLAGAAPQFFFAPTQIEKVVAQLGREGYEAELGAAARAFNAAARPWITSVRESGPEAVDRRWLDAVEGRIPPDHGVILRL